MNANDPWLAFSWGSCLARMGQKEVASESENLVAEACCWGCESLFSEVAIATGWSSVSWLVGITWYDYVWNVNLQKLEYNPHNYGYASHWLLELSFQVVFPRSFLFSPSCRKGRICTTKTSTWLRKHLNERFLEEKTCRTDRTDTHTYWQKVGSQLAHFGISKLQTPGFASFQFINQL